MERDAITDVLQLFGAKPLSVLSTVAAVTIQFIIGLLMFRVQLIHFYYIEMNYGHGQFIIVR
jgi:hypothetical protein